MLVDRDGVIERVGRAREVAVPSGVPVVDLGETALLPGLVNAHAHPELTLLRGALEDLSFPEWLRRLVELRRRAPDAAADLLAARWATVEAVRAGITTLAATEASGAAARALAEAGLGGVVYQEVFGPHPDDAARALRKLKAAVEGLQEWASERVRIGLSPHAPYTVSDQLYRAVAGYAASTGLPLALHCAESEAEREYVAAGAGVFAERLRARGIETRARGRSTVELLDRLGVLALRPLLIHCTTVDGEDVERISERGCPVTHCPIANAKLGHGVAPLAALLERGVAVGLGTDSVASNNRMDVLEEARFAALLQRAGTGAGDTLPARALLELCTLGGARALGLDDRIGTLEPGKHADLCAISLAGAHTLPVHDPEPAVIHAARASDVVLTVAGGRVVYQDGRVLTVDEDALRREIGEVARRTGGS